jgi:hypothetical protein
MAAFCTAFASLVYLAVKLQAEDLLQAVFEKIAKMVQKRAKITKNGANLVFFRLK